MKIILTISDTKGKNLVFASDNLQTYSLDKMVELAKNKSPENLYVVQRKSGSYLRTKKNAPKGSFLDQISVSSSKFISSIGDINKTLLQPNLKNYWNVYQNALVNEQKFGKDLIVVDGVARATKELVSERILPNKQFIFDAAKMFSVDPYLLGAILIDEITRLSPFEEICDKILANYINKNVSVGIGQVMLETARGLIKNGYYNPNPSDDKLSNQNIGKATKSYLYQYVIQPKYNINFSAAKMKSLVDGWKLVAQVDLDANIIATLYSLGYIIPHKNPQVNSRGEQIASEFYAFAKEILQ